MTASITYAPTTSWKPEPIRWGFSCPFCLQMMTEGIQAKGQSDTKEARDVLEILADSIGDV